MTDAPLTPDEFDRVDIRVGRIVRAERFPEARRPAYKLWVDVGEMGVRQSSAQITELYDPTDLPGRQVLAIVNFPPKKIAGFSSEVLVLGVPTDDGVVLLMPERDAPLGSRVY